MYRVYEAMLKSGLDPQKTAKQCDPKMWIILPSARQSKQTCQGSFLIFEHAAHRILKATC